MTASSFEELKPAHFRKEETLASTYRFEMSQARYVKPYAEIVDPERGSYGQPPQDNLFPDEKKSTIESGISLIDMPSARDMTRVKPDKEAAYDEKEADVKVVTVIANPVLPSAAAAAKSSQMQVFAIRAGFIFLGEG